MAAEKGKVIDCHSVDHWNELLRKGTESNQLVVAYFMKPRPRQISFIRLDTIAKLKTNVIFVKIMVDELKSVADEWEVEGTPNFVLIKEGKVVDRVVGAYRYHVARAVVKHSV